MKSCQYIRKNTINSKRKKNKIMKDHILKLEGRTVAFIDYANIKAWVLDKNFFIDLKILYDALIAVGIEKIIFYYGNDLQNPASFAFLNKLRTFGFEVVTKPVRYLRINLLNLLDSKINRALFQELDPQAKETFITEFKKLKSNDIKIFYPKANFDVEITLDMVLFTDKFENFILFSGDGDFVSIVRYLRSKNKKVIVVSGRKFLAGELLQAASKFVTLERLATHIHLLLIKQDPRKRRS